MSQSFQEIAQGSGSDKYGHHGYHRFYPKHLDSLRNRSGNILEIGINTGASLALWQNYFPNAFIHGADIGFEEEGDRYRVHKIDQSDPDQLRYLARTIGSASFIIDDGSHIPEHQILSLDILFPNALEPGGVYVIEDIEVSYWRKGILYGYETSYGLHCQRSAVEVCKWIVEFINGEFVNLADKPYLVSHAQALGLTEDFLTQVASVEFCHNCIILRKKESWEYMYTDRPYRSHHHT